MNIKTRLLTTTCLLLATAITAQADTRYIIDQLVVTVRSNRTSNYQTLTTLPTASPVEVLEEDKKFVKVRTKKGVEGYILKQYVTRKTPKSILLAELKRQKAELEQKLASQQQQFQQANDQAASSNAQIEQLTAELIATGQQLERVSKDYAELKQQAENVINLTNERDQLQEENDRMAGQLQVLQEENEAFHRSNMIQWFLAGGGVFLAGWLAGKVSRKKRGYSRF